MRASGLPPLDPGTHSGSTQRTAAIVVGAVGLVGVGVGPTGYLDSFSGDYNGQVPLGPRRGDGAYTISGYSDQITMAP